MKTKMIHFLALITVASLFLVSCGSSVPKVTSPAESLPSTETESNAPETEKIPETVIIHSGDPDNKVRAEAYLKALPDKTFDGASFIITAPDTSLFDPSEISYLSEGISERNRVVEEKFGVTVSCVKSDLGTMLENAKKSAAAETFYSHIMVMPMTSVPTFSVYELLMNLRSMPLLDMTKPYFNASSVGALSLGNKTYGIAGEALPASLGLPAVFFNKNIADAVGLDELYDVALDGELTWDKMHEYYAAAAAGGYVAAATDGGDAIDAVYISTGEKYVSSYEGKTPSIAIANYSMNVAATQYRTIVNYAAAAGITKEGAFAAFREGNVLFTIAKVGESDSLNGSAVRLGMLPMPKTSIDSPYRHLADGSAEVFTVTNGVTDSAMVSLVLSGLCAASFGVLSEDISDYLHASILPDSRSADVYELMTKSTYYDLSSAYAPHYTEISAGSIELVRHIIETGDFSSFDTSVANANNFFAVNYPPYE